ARAGQSQGPKGASASAGGGRPSSATNSMQHSGGRANSSPSGGSATAALANEAASVGAQHPAEPVIRVENLSAGYDETVILHDINFEVYPGEVLGILGGSGGGERPLFETLN